MRKGKDGSLLWASLAIGVAVWILCTIGLLILDSASLGKSSLNTIVLRQSQFMAVAFVALLATTFIDLHKLRKLAIPIAIICIILLVLVLIKDVGKSVNGSQRWLPLFGSIAIQPSDFAKVALVLLLSTFLHENQRRLHTFTTGILKPMCIIGIFCLLIIVEPDFGTTALCGMVGVTLMFIAGSNWKILLSSGVIFSILAGVLLSLSPVRLRRITAFMDIENTKFEGSYQLYQAILGFGSGGVYGQGIGMGRQQLSFLPEAHTDFVFAIVGEELGMFATISVVVLFAIIFFVGIWSMQKAKNRFELYMLAGALFTIIYQAIFNLCVVTGLMPTKGISLPLISYGGSNLLVTFIFLGIIFNCYRSWSKPTKIKAVEYE